MPPPEAQPTTPQRVLLVDDDPDVHDLVRVWLMDEGVDLHDCFDGAACLALARATPAPDLILLDVDLPGTDGFAVCRALKSDPATAAIPVIFLTGAASSEEKLQGLELGASDYVTKPFEPAELRARVRSALRTRHLMNLLEREARVLQESEERFRFLAEDSSDLVSRHDAAGVYLYASPAAAPLLGVSGESLLGRPLLDLIHPDDRAVVTAPGSATLREFPATAVRVRHADGAYRWLELTIRAARDGSTFQASARDVGRRKRMEELEQDRARVLEMVAVGRALDDVLAYVTGMLERHHPAVPACVLALNEGHLRVVGPSLPEEFLSALRAHALRLAAALCSGAMTDGRGAMTSDVSADQAWRPLREVAARHGFRVCTSRLVQSAGQGVIGLVGIFLPAARDPDLDMQHLLDVAVGLVAVVVEHRQLGERLAYQARHDPLTGLPNRLLFEDRLHHAIDDSSRDGTTSGKHVALLLFDVDRFKLVNDTLGHQAGDDLLRQFAQRAQGATRQTDTLARLGGDEFALLLPTLTSPEQAVEVARSIQAAIRAPFVVAGRELSVTTSIGIALCPTDAADAETLLGRADLALYRVKAAGRDGLRRYEPGMDPGAAA
jgi:diguanylate cyclase (GGDEF)-like protein/PAS domain S-box-containing protein